MGIVSFEPNGRQNARRTAVSNTGLTPPKIVAILNRPRGRNKAETTSTFAEAFLYEMMMVDRGSRLTTLFEEGSEGKEKTDTRPLAEIASNWLAERDRDRRSESSGAENAMWPWFESTSGTSQT